MFILMLKDWGNETPYNTFFCLQQTYKFGFWHRGNSEQQYWPGADWWFTRGLGDNHSDNDQDQQWHHNR